MNRDLIEQYARGGSKLAAAVRGLISTELAARPVPGAWSIHQIVIHLLDSDLIAADRMKRIIAEEAPTLIGFDESKFAQNLFYNDQSVEDAVSIFSTNRKNFARVLRNLPDSAYRRIGMHNERGPMSLEQVLETYVKHLDHHLEFIYKKRALIGRPFR